MRNKDFDEVNVKDHTDIHSKSGILTQIGLNDSKSTIIVNDLNTMTKDTILH